MKRLLCLLLLFARPLLLGQDDLVSLEVVPREVVTTPPHTDVKDKFWFVSRRWLWFGVARSDVVVVGTIDRQNSEPLETIIQIDECLKGEGIIGNAASLRVHYSHPEKLEVSENRLVLSGIGGKYVFFLTRAPGVSSFLLESRFSTPLLEATDGTIDSIRKEVSREQPDGAILESDVFPQNLRFRKELETALSSMTESLEEQMAFVKCVLDLGIDCAPELIVYLLKEPPNRELPMHVVALPNSEGAFEPFRLYDPNTTVELIDSLLEHITWMPLKQDYFDGKEETARCIKQTWQVFFEKWCLFAKSNDYQFRQPVIIHEE